MRSLAQGICYGRDNAGARYRFYSFIEAAHTPYLKTFLVGEGYRSFKVKKSSDFCSNE